MSPDLHLTRHAPLGIASTQAISISKGVPQLEQFMQSQGISRRDYERLHTETKSKLAGLLDIIKADLRHHGISLRFLGLSGNWKDISAPIFLAQSEEHYQRQIMGSKWVTSTKRRDLVDRISELYKIASKNKLEEIGLETWLG